MVCVLFMLLCVLKMVCVLFMCVCVLSISSCVFYSCDGVCFIGEMVCVLFM